MISIDNLHFSYKRKEVFSGLDLRLKTGHIYGLMGANGTGKSTLLRCIAGLLFPGKGKIAGFGHQPKERHPRSEEQPSELQSLMRISYAVFCLKKKTKQPH